MDLATVPGLTTALRARGYRVRGPAGIGSRGTSWAAEAADGRRVVVGVLDLDLTLAERKAAVARIDALREVDHPHLAALIDVVALDGHRTVLVTEAVDGPTVGAALEVRPGWQAGEVVTLLVPLAQALEALHGAGLVHGDVAPENIVLAAGGRPVLVDLAAVVLPGPGTPGFAATGAREHTSGDVFALARLGLAALGDPSDAAGESLREVLHGATGKGAAQRPGAHELAAACYDVAAPVPVEVPEAAVLTRLALTRLAAGGPQVRTEQDPRTLRRRRAATVAGLVGVAATVATGLVLGLGAMRPDGSEAPATVAEVDGGAAVTSGVPSRDGVDDVASHDGTDDVAGPDDVVVAAAVSLTERRAEVLTARSPERLAEVTLPGSVAFETDRALIESLAVRGAEIEVRAEVLEARRLEPDGDRELVLVTSRLLVAGQDDPPPARSVVLALTRTPEGWRVAEVLDAAAAGTEKVSDSPGPLAG